MSARLSILLRCLVLAGLALTPATAWSAGQETDSETPVDKPLNPLAEASDVERTSVRQLLGSGQWPQRVVALMRLQRFDCPESADLIASGLNDQAPNVRCFALLVLGHRQVPQSAHTAWARRGYGVGTACVRMGDVDTHRRMVARACKACAPLARRRRLFFE